MRLPASLPAVLFSALCACASGEAEPGRQEADHTAGAPVAGGHAWQWADESEAEFLAQEAAVARQRRRRPRSYLPSEHPMSVRLQGWVTRIDEALRAEHETAMAAVPAPRVLVADATDANAWVTPLAVRWTVPARFLPRWAGADDTPSSRRNEDEYLLTSGARVLQPALASLERPHDTEALSQLLRFFGDGFEHCELGLQDGVVTFGTECLRDISVDGNRADHLGFHATARHLSVTTAYLFDLADEDQIVSTLAHELGHYYRSHANLPTDAFNYFYALDQGDHAHKPPPAEEHLEATRRARAKLRSGAFDVDWSAENLLMAEHGLGFYTDEQEADELSLELLAKIGVPPQVALEKALALLQRRPPAASDRSGALGFEACQALAARDFKDEHGHWVSVPVGDPSDAHHSLCFRAFNVARELAAHDYALAPRLEPEGPSFGELLASLRAP